MASSWTWTRCSMVMMDDKYGFTSKGWKIIPEYMEIPQDHMEFIEDYSSDLCWWADPRRCHSTMTPLWTLVWGGVRAFVMKEKV